MSHQLMQHGPLDPISNRAQGPKSKIRIAYAVGWLRNAGTEGQLLELLRHLDRSQFDPFLILMENAGAQKAEALVNESFVMGVSLGGSSRWLLRSFSFAEAIFRTSRCLRRWRCDVVHAFLPGPSILAGAAARLAKTPVVIGSR